MQMPVEKTPVDKIIELAKSRNLVLVQLLRNTSVDAFYGPVNAVFLLAKEGDAKTVDILMDQFKANPNWAVAGAAAGGHSQLVDSLLGKGALLSYAMYGAGMSGDMKLVDKLEAKGGYLSWALCGASGLEQASTFYNDIYSIVSQRVEFAPSDYFFYTNLNDPTRTDQLKELPGFVDHLLIAAAAMRGDEKIVDDYLEGYELDDDDDPLIGYTHDKLDYAIRGAFAGHQEPLIRKFDLTLRDRIKHAAYGAGQGGHLDLIWRLVDHSPKKIKTILDWALLGAASHGHRRVVSKLIEAQADPSPALKQAALFLQVGILNDLKELETTVFPGSLDISGENLDAYRMEVLRMGSFIDNAKIRQQFIAKACDFHNLDSENLSKDASAINKLMHKYKINYNQALVWNDKNLRLMLLQFIQTGLPAEAVQNITRHIFSLSEQEVYDLAKKISDQHASWKSPKFKFAGEIEKVDEKQTQEDESQERKEPKL
jgi:hypothetical protein